MSTLKLQRHPIRHRALGVRPPGERHARRKPQPAKGEAGAAFAANGDVYFTSARPDPDSPLGGDPVSALWLLPQIAGEARVVLSRAGGVGQVMAARDANATFVTANFWPAAATRKTTPSAAEPAKTTRWRRSCTANIRCATGTRTSDRAQPRIFAVETGDRKGTRQARPPLMRHRRCCCATSPPTPARGSARRNGGSPDGGTIYTSYTRPLAKADCRSVLVAVDVATASRRCSWTRRA